MVQMGKQLFQERAMPEISLVDAAGKFADLVERARHEETIEITEDGQAIARLVPAAEMLEPIDIERLRALTASLPFDPEPMETWILKFRDDPRY
jgi:prevent-host-death family protein